nr:translocation/assembly module TamB domain-containing protein [Pseudomonas sp.]
RIVIDRLSFPSVIRSVPDDYRVREWVDKHASGGSIEASGSWSLEDASGSANVQLTRYPIVQRADRFIAGSGNIRIEASPKRLRVDGKVTADLGWISLEGASDLPSLASDVVIVRAGDSAQDSKPLPLLLNLEVNLGDNFYLRGMGLDTGLAGTITVRNQRSGLRANGVVTARDGRFSIYGQTLVVRRGNVTFEGLLDDPLLDIVAVRPNLRIEAGVQVSGTARQPIITLLSYPDVPEVEKLSWLLLGRGPDASGADAGMLLAAAASLLSDEGSEPIYKQLGLDEMGLRSGEGRSARGLLPEQTVVSSVNNMSTSDAGTQFLVVGKRLTEALYLTFEQAISGRESVVRASYRISNTLSAAVQGGTVNGLRLVWSFVFDD